MVLTVLPIKKPCLWVAGGCGALLFAGGFLCAFVAFPALVDWQVDLNYDLWNEESQGYKNFVSTATLPASSAPCVNSSGEIGDSNMPSFAEGPLTNDVS